jgi:sulfatase maturation enzyme AslB (radical SAM superfamily)
MTKPPLKSVYLKSAENVFTKLNEVSPSFCLAKWFNVSIHIPIGKTHSCYHPLHHSIPVEEVLIDVSALHNTNYKKEQRKLMLEGKRPSECNFCWEIEDSGSQLSDRAYRSADIFEDGLIEEAKDLGHFGNANPRYVEVNFNQACNFKCSYCSPHLSTTWYQEIEKFGSYELSNRPHHNKDWVDSLNIDNSPKNIYLEAFWKWFPTIYDNLQTFRMTGGEPLMDKNTFKMFDYVREHPHPKLHLSITSNCCPPKDQWEKFMDSFDAMVQANSFDHFILFCSLDSIGKQAEYIRHGLDYDLLYNNITNFLTRGEKHALSFIITFNVFSYFKFFDYMKMVLDLRRTYNNKRELIWFDVPHLSYPEYMNPKLIPQYVTELEKTMEFMKENIRTTPYVFNGFYDFEISKVQRLIDWIQGNDPNFNEDLSMKNFYLFFREHDRRRDTNLVETFPELETFYNNCKEKVSGSS